MYYRSKQACSDTRGAADVLYSVVLQCIPNNCTESFVHTVVAASEPMAVLCIDQQLDEMVRF